MAWDFTTEPEFQAKLDWASGFVDDKVYKVDVLWPHDNYKPTKDLTQQQKDVIAFSGASDPKFGVDGAVASQIIAA